jgi:hypothetical protein
MKLNPQFHESKLDSSRRLVRAQRKQDSVLCEASENHPQFDGFRLAGMRLGMFFPC